MWKTRGNSSPHPDKLRPRVGGGAWNGAARRLQRTAGPASVCDGCALGPPPLSRDVGRSQYEHRNYSTTSPATVCASGFRSALARHHLGLCSDCLCHLLSVV